MDKELPLFVGLVGLVLTLIQLNNRVYENAKSTTQLKYHNHGPDAPDHPYTMDGELIHTLDGIRGWY